MGTAQGPGSCGSLTMLDILLVVLGLGSFALLGVYARLCDRV